ncbi:recombinase family protein [Sinomonas gamaensis]|uniref:recombinase family protein n=1 Tax=Sinomonas gamaensis TaxID=2565624 RepID=UPI001109B2D7|nr:recombinase family protein [Sinomonas gamaensis]
MLPHSKGGQTVAYQGASSEDQNLARQVELVGEVDRSFEEKVSGSSREGRAALAQMIAYVRTGDTVVVASMDRLARSLTDLRQLVDELVGKGVAVRFVKERLTFEPGESDKYAQFQLSMLGAVAELERAIIHERQADGIKAAKARGVYKGRARALNSEQVVQALEQIAAGVPKAEVARRLRVDRTTLYRSLAAAADSNDILSL